MKRKFVFLIFTYLVLASCTNGQVNTRERQIRFPKYEKFVCLGKEIPSANLKKTSMKIVMYADSTGCTGCKLQLDMWKLYIGCGLADSNNKSHIRKLLWIRWHNL